MNVDAPQHHTLVVVRHGHAANPRSGGDFERPLTERGRRQTEDTGRVLVERELVPRRVLASPAERVRATTETLCDVLRVATDLIEWVPTIYEASPQTLFELVASHFDSPGPTLLVGHNPGLSALVHGLCADQIGAHNWRGMDTGSWAWLEVPLPMERNYARFIAWGDA